MWIEAGETYVLRVETEPGQPVGVGVDATDPYAAGQRLGGVASEDLSFAAYVWTCSGGECGAALDCSGNGDCTAADTCLCDLGWEGDACDTPVCLAPCQNGGTCVGPETCDCAGTGYHGTRCQLADAAPPPPPPDRADEWRARAEELCRDANARLADLGVPVGPAPISVDGRVAGA